MLVLEFAPADRCLLRLVGQGAPTVFVPGLLLYLFIYFILFYFIFVLLRVCRLIRVASLRPLATQLQFSSVSRAALLGRIEGSSP